MDRAPGLGRLVADPQEHWYHMHVRHAIIATLIAAAVAFATHALAQSGHRTYTKAGTFEDIVDNLKEAIIKRGLVIDYTGQLNAMLERTAVDTGTVSDAGTKSPFRHAQFLQFCPAKLTHEAVAASPLAIANCPVAVYVYELRYEPGKVYVGYRYPVQSPSKRVNQVNQRLTTLLHEIATEATK